MSKRQPKSAVSTASISAEPVATAASIPIPNKDGRDSKVSEEAVRLNAYFKWERAGKPADDGTHFWLEAEKELKGAK
jgi:hypothetical protein